MIGSGDLRKGVAIELDGQLYQILDYHHLKMGRGSAQIRLKLRDIRAGHTVERTFQAGEKFVRARLDHHTMQYLYNDGNLYYFMDTDNFEQMPITAAQLGDTINYLKDGMSLEVLTYKDEPVGVEMPIMVELQVVDTGPAFKGDTASAGNKPAVVETGITIQVPLFINNGDIIKVDSRTGEYLERLN